MHRKHDLGRIEYVFWQKTRFLAVFNTFSILKRAKSNKLFAKPLAPLREGQFFVYNSLLVYWTYGLNLEEVRFVEH